MLGVQLMMLVASFPQRPRQEGQPAAVWLYGSILDGVAFPFPVGDRMENAG